MENLTTTGFVYHQVLGLVVSAPLM